ncbi:transmembrane reductase CYB561D2 [Chrysoperla carnea]|uniref:transmembrane reductase CYB561D2 n=1 Tax=Chrysoperla carnea TaxID=189513 RepID=UPI001D07538D|nr:transmembrane reductase CYB561D2 [Chrysoperla carnea]
MIDKKKLSRAFNISILIAHGCLLFVVGFIFVICFTSTVTLFTWHPILLTIGWVFLLQGILIFPRENIVTRDLSHKWRVTLHWILQSVGALSLLCGFIIIIVNKFKRDGYHFQTYHSQYGLAFFILAALTISGGVYTNFFKNTVFYKFVHSIFGIGTLIIGAVAFILSFYSGFTVQHSAKFMQYLCITLLIYVHIIVLLRPLLTMLNRIRYLAKA